MPRRSRARSWFVVTLHTAACLVGGLWGVVLVVLVGYVGVCAGLVAAPVAEAAGLVAPAR